MSALPKVRNPAQATVKLVGADDTMTTAEVQKFADTEKAMDRDAASYFNFIKNLFVIYTERLYRKDYGSFESYCQDRWGIGRNQGHRYIQAQRVIAALGSAEPDQGDAPAPPMPTSQRQTRPLVGLPEPVARAAWSKAVEKAGGSQPGMAAVEAAVAEVAPELARPKARPKADPVEKARAAGIIPEGVEVDVFDPTRGETPGAEEPESPAADPSLSDEEYAKTLPAWGRLSERSQLYFKAEAGYYRAVEAARLAFTKVHSKAKAKASRAALGHIGPYSNRISRALRQNDPTRWQACAECGGTGELPVIGQCGACHGHGFQV